MTAVEYYLLTIAIYCALNGIAAIGLNIQFGLVGIYNFAYIVLVAVGAYATSIAQLPPSPGGFNRYVGGFGWGFPANLGFGILVTLAFGLVLSLICFSRIGHWYLALTLSAIGNGLLLFTANEPGLVNGVHGLFGIKGPFQDQLSARDYQLVFLAISGVALVLVYLLFRRIERSPLGRAMRTLREDELAARSLGKNPLKLKRIAFLLGSGAAGLAGGLMAMYFGSWSTDSWQPTETFALIAAITVGGRGWSRGAVLGSIVVIEGLGEASKFLPTIADRPELLPSIQAVALSLVLLGVLWWRPFGLWPEPRERFDTAKGVAKGSPPFAKLSSALPSGAPVVES